MLGKGHGVLNEAPTKEESERLGGREVRSSLLILDLKDGEMQDSGKHEEGKTFHKLHVLGMNDDLWDRVRGLGSKLGKSVNALSFWLF